MTKPPMALTIPEPAEQLINVQWIDSWSGSQHWESRDKIDMEFGPVSTVGFLVSKNDRWIAIAQSISEDQLGNVQHIPIGCITELVVLSATIEVPKAER